MNRHSSAPEDRGRPPEPTIGDGELLARDRQPERPDHPAALRRFRQLLDRGDELILIFDAASLRITDANETAGELLRRDAGDLPGRSLSECHPAFARAAQDAIDRPGQPIPTRAEIRDPDGTARTVDGWTRVTAVDERPTGALVARDITERLRAEAASRDSESRYRRLHESMRDAFAYCDMTGALLDFNPAFEAMLGYSTAELRRLTYRDLTPEQWHALEADIVERQVLARGYSDVYEKEYRRKDGTALLIEARTFLMRDAAGQPTGMWAILRDITERKRAEAALRASEARFRDLTAMASDWFWEQDDQFRFTYFSMSEAMSALERIGAGLGRMLGKARWELPIDLTPAQWAAHRALLDAHRPFQDFEYRIAAESGEDRWFSVNGKPVFDDSGRFVGYRGTGRDITERKRNEQKLLESERQYRELVENANSIILRWNRQGEITFLNEFGLRFFGYAEAELIGQHVVGTIVPPDESSGRDLRPLMDAICRHPQQFERNVNENMRRDGKRVWIAWTNRAVIDDRGEVAEVFSVGSDITERKLAEEELARQTTLFRNLFEGSPDAIAILDHEDRVLEFNRSFATLFGYRETEAHGRPINDLLAFDPSLRDAREASRAVFERGQIVEKEAVRLAKDGRRLDVHLVGYPNFIGGRLFGAFAIYRDISDRKRAEALLRQSRNLLQTVIDTIPVRVFWKDRDSKYLGCNRAFALDAGLNSPHEIIGLDDYQMGWSEQAGLYRNDDKRVLDTGQPKIDYEEPRTTPDGRHIWLRASKVPLQGADGAVFGVLGTYQDITDRKRAEDALRDNEAKFRRLIEALPIAMGVSDEQGNIEYLNARFTERFGYRREEVSHVGDWFERAYPDPAYRQGVQERWLAGLERAKQDGADFVTSDLDIVCADGSVRVADVIGAQIGDKTLAIFNDITDRKRAEKRLLFANALLSAEQAASIDGILVVDARGNILSSNPRFAEIWSIPEAVLATGSDERTLAYVLDKLTDPQEFLDRVRYLYAHPDLKSREEITLKDGRTLDRYSCPMIGADGIYYGRLWSFHDISERKRAEEAVRTSEAFYRSIFENSLFGIGISGPGMKLIQVNPAFCRMLEYDGEEVVGKLGIGDVTHPDDLSSSREMVIRLVCGEIDDFIIEKRYLAKSGKTIDALAYVKAIRDRAGAYQGSSATILDITERKRAEAELARHRDHLEELVAERTAELRQAMNQLVQVEKLAALGNLVAGMAHELNTPLGNARTVASALGEHLREFAAAAESGALRRSQLDAFLGRGREAVALLERNAARAADLIGQFKQVAVDQTSVRRRRFGLRQVTEEVLATLQPLFKRTAHRVELAIPPELELDSYPGPLEQVLVNLINNSTTHGFQGVAAGLIEIRAAPLGEGRVQIDYTDDGAGIPDSILKRVFEPFFTTKLGQGGSGLGLYIVYNLVTGILGGTIEAHSPPGQGTRFTLVLPRSGPEQSPEEAIPCKTI